ncbi:MAG: spermidine synthase [Legionella sp.]
MWKTKLGVCIYTSPSGYKVYQNLFYRWLTLGSDARQTVINRYAPHNPILYYLTALTLMAREHPGPTCLLGLGGAGVALMLDEVPLVAVDNSNEVIEIAQRFFMIDRLKNLTIIHQNAMNYVQQCKDRYMHLMVDLYTPHLFPPECANDTFFSACKKIITDDGFLALNLANINEQKTIFQLVKKHFKHSLVIPIRKSANMVILAANNENNEVFLNNMNKTNAFKRIMLVNDWGYVGDYK